MKINVNKGVIAACLLTALGLSSCRSLQQPSSVEQPIDYSNYDFSNEVESYKSIANISELCYSVSNYCIKAAKGDVYL